jgi:hypothetical protein
MLAEFLAEEDFHAHDFLTKNHLSNPSHKSLLLAHEDVFVLDVVRDLRDVVVSAYYDSRNRDGYEGSFEDYYWESGRELAAAVSTYHELWKPDGVRILRVSYERLKSDFGDEVSRVATFFGIELSPERLRDLQTQTSIDSLKARYEKEELYRDNKFFRKGIVGDWQNHFSPPMIRDIARIEKNGLSQMVPGAMIRKLRARIARVLRRTIT